MVVAPNLNEDFIGDELPDKSVARDFYAKYEPKEVLGRGVSSTVRRCIEKESGKEFAAKIIDVSGDLEDSQGLTLRQATRREISILRIVAGHPYIIELHDVFESSTYIFLVFEICRNGELFDYLTSVVALSEKKTKAIMRQLFEALEHIHSKNVVHRDLKPENILLDDNMNIKITDFGFAKVLKPTECLYDLCGTPGYLAPELLRAAMYENTSGYGKEVDIWACGVIMYTLLVGFPPFWHRKQMIMLRNIMEGKYEFCSPEWDHITDQPKDLIRKILVVDPKKRIKLNEILQHEFFRIVHLRERPFNAKKAFQLAILVTRAMVRITRLKYTPEAMSIDIIKSDPYRVKSIRKAVDGCAFRIYNHWVKRGEVQNRAALFENKPKQEMKLAYHQSLTGNNS
ncbi:phosphorylase b kinase gamma catalytic chain: skeletal muscle/heart isoform-like isoform X1 [Dinothrombium tinctorium]|uniref:phosphorylase kinase n=1 Tax=Dinothrombium tinctorium TaxID=1965070 RepID=A0A3S3QXR3_9ACAR|nr:phosphorylase b kinase gamma catalytic chain: skeletal muscle/heart isoform-like isoform X1 [Dinothrombium tinctorium]